MSGLTDTESKIIFDGIAKVGEMSERIASMETDILYIKEKLSTRKTDLRYAVTTAIAIIAAGIALFKAFLP